MKILINQYSNCTIEANVGIAQVPGQRQMTWPQRSKQSGVNAAFLQGFVLILSWEIDVNCNEQRIPASKGECLRRTNPA
jgi:ribosome-binding ATPase YchF (GTP1/OBG family)